MRSVVVGLATVVLGVGLLLPASVPAHSAPAVEGSGATAVLPAFPGAAGFGSSTPGGRGGSVMAVTSLANSGSGTLRAALEAEGARTVVFRVAGTIRLTSPISVRNPYLTVAGQTSPGNGITVRGAPLLIRTHDVVIRYLRIRPGSDTSVDPEKLDGITILDTDNDAAHDIVIDHVSATWSVDENMGAWYGPRDVTVQWSLLAEGLAHANHLKDNGTCCDIHSMGFLVGPGTRRISLHHNVFAHNNGRSPHFLGGVHGEIVNNLVFDWGYAATEIEPLGGSTRVDIIGNRYIPGKTSYPAPRGVTYFGPGRNGQMFLRDNLGPRRPTGTEPEWDIAAIDRAARGDVRSTVRVSSGSGVIPDAATGLESTLLPAVGATEPLRDSIDQRIIESVTNRVSGLVDDPEDVGGYLVVPLGTAPVDTDQDGMPDAWESSHGLNPMIASDRNGDADLDGYTNLEEYLNALVS